ncbi:MAG TPA: DUF1800 domain-containing protein [Stellaceae bacterium]|nr:DUF1800 domain-containing protein [Stellaceae bacterium]
MTAFSALIAATRFGFAARPGELQTLAQDPRGAVLKQLSGPPPALAGDLPTGTGMTALFLQSIRDKRAPQDRKEFNQRVNQVYFTEIEARLDAAVTSERPYVERLVHFWSNHFTVSARRPFIRGIAGAYEREAIRPHVLGRFSDMLLAVESHQGMLLYLDNAQSIGPDSQAGMRSGRGLNENLGREILELHTLGVDGGYTQDDVEALARILTGWSIARPQEPAPGSFRFRPFAHEPGAKTLLGKRYAEGGQSEGIAALADLAVHPATARHVARKLAAHFIADNPPPDAVDRIAKRFLESGGDLRHVSEGVAREEAAWRGPFAKVRSPADLAIAACRVTGVAPRGQQWAQSLRMLDQLPFYAPQPSGWPDDAASWVSPEAVLRRAQWCEAFANRMPDTIDPAALANASLGDAAPAEIVDAIAHAPSRRDGVALLLASAEFQRR